MSRPVPPCPPRDPSGLAGLAALAFCMAMPSPAEAIPAFARRYETSCQTCHVAYPKLTPFGEAFRRNAYRFPAGGDALAVKQDPIPLGAEAQKERWPDAVWPGELPAILPLSLIVDGQATWAGGDTPAAAGGGHGHGASEPAAYAAPASRIGIGGLGGHVGVRSMGTLGDAVAFLASIDFGGHEAVEVERAAVLFTPFAPGSLHLKVGRFEPALHGVSIHRGLLGHELGLTTTAVGANPWRAEHAVTGAEVSGVAWGRLGWAAGVAENATPDLYDRKDAYGRVEVKLGGMRLDGVAAEAATAAWRERSLTLGASAWSGGAAIFLGDLYLHRDDFLRAGLDLHAVVDDLQLDLVAVRQQHDQPTTDARAGRTLDLALAELTWVVHPAAFPSIRAEFTRVTGGAAIDSTWKATAQVTAVLRPNVVLRLLGRFGTAAGHDAGFESAALAVSTAF